MINSILNVFEKHTWILYMILAVFTLVTLGLTLLPAEIFSDSPIFDYSKLGHVFMFGSWTFLLGLLLLSSGQTPLPLFSIFLAGSLFGISVEILQEVLPTNRNMDVQDMIADVVGSLLAVLFLKVLTYNRRKERFKGGTIN